MQLTLMSAGETLLGNLLQAGQTTQIDSFTIAGTVNASVDPTLGTGPVGPILYSGVPSQVRYTPVSQDEIVFAIYLDDTVGGTKGFGIGNFMLFLKAANAGGAPVPFLFGSLPTVANKNQDNFPQYVVGNNVVFYCSVWFPYISRILDVTNLPSFIAGFPQYADELTLPPASTSDYEQVTIDTYSGSAGTAYDGATIVVRDTKNLLWWGLSYAQTLGDPRFGQIDGGIAGSEYGSPSSTQYVFGSSYVVNNSSFPLIDGGTTWATPNDPPLLGGAY